MDVALQWRGYRLGISLARKREARRETLGPAAQCESGPAMYRYEDNAWRDHTLASGSGHVGLIR
ncbi:MAG TPA: hypothetical protein ENO24_03030 [Chloroflexi bacterium]|nr:hypothetical protein [Chloroflexota bacterium]